MSVLIMTMVMVVAAMMLTVTMLTVEQNNTRGDRNWLWRPTCKIRVMQKSSKRNSTCGKGSAFHKYSNKSTCGLGSHTRNHRRTNTGANK